MKYLFEPEGLKILEAFSLSDTLMVFDFDGTLAPIVLQADEAEMSAITRSLLKKLRKFAPIAIISGRARNDLLHRVPQDTDYLIGNHGLEGLPSSTGSLEQVEKMIMMWADQLAPLLDFDLGIDLENKFYSLALHYRKSKDRNGSKLKILEFVSELSPAPRILMGKAVVNLVAPGAPHKGVALLEIMLKSQKRTALFVGDDDNDEDVFGLGEENLLTVRVGKSDKSSALYYLKSQEEMDRLLSILIENHLKKLEIQKRVRIDLYE